ncbi:MAG: DUF192 domain-containing protein [Blastocatellia bacterium]|nr:DUF192 domain-containing protein [Blastocatellia bacterium]
MAKKQRSGAKSHPHPTSGSKTKKTAGWRRIFFLSVAVVGLLLAVAFSLPQTQTWLDDVRYGEQKLPTTTVTLPDGKKLKVELARTPQEHEIGLMFRKALAPDRGMLFVYDKEGLHTFWMKNTLIDLDMVFIGADKRVTSVEANVSHTTAATPDTQIPRRSGRAQYILEISAGRAQALGIKPGTPVSFSL